MSILKLIASSSFLTVNKEIARKLSLDAAVLFADLASAQVFWNDREQSSDVWFFRTRETIGQETTLKKRKQLSAYKLLTANNLIKEKIAGVPAKKYYLIDSECLENLHGLLLQNATARCCKTKQLDVAKCNGINKNKENKNKDNNKSKEKNFKKETKSDFSKPTQDEVNQIAYELKTEKKEKKEKVPRKRKKAFCVQDCDFPPIFEQNEKLKQIFIDFAEMRQELKKPYRTKKGTETKLNTLAKDCDRFGIDNVIGAIEFSLGSEYLGIFVNDFVNKQQRHEQQQQKINNNNAEPESLHESFAKRLGIDFYKDGNLNGNFTS